MIEDGEIEIEGEPDDVSRRYLEVNYEHRDQTRAPEDVPLDGRVPARSSSSTSGSQDAHGERVTDASSRATAIESARALRAVQRLGQPTFGFQIVNARRRADRGPDVGRDRDGSELSRGEVVHDRDQGRQPPRARATTSSTAWSGSQRGRSAGRVSQVRGRLRRLRHQRDARHRRARYRARRRAPRARRRRAVSGRRAHGPASCARSAGPRPSAAAAGASSTCSGSPRRPSSSSATTGPCSASSGRCSARCCSSGSCSSSSPRSSASATRSRTTPALLLLNVMLFGLFQEATDAAVQLGRRQRGRRPQDAVPAARDPARGRAHRGRCSSALNLIVVFVIIIATGVEPDLDLDPVPALVIVALLVLTTALSMLLSALYVRVRDIAIIWTVLGDDPLLRDPGPLPDRRRARTTLPRPHPDEPADADLRAGARVGDRPRRPRAIEAVEGNGLLLVVPALLYVGDLRRSASGSSTARRRGSPRSSERPTARLPARG